MNLKIIKLKEKFKYLNWSYYKNNFEYFSFIIIYIILLISLSINQLRIYWHVNTALKIARVCGILISFNFAFSLVMVLRKTLTFLRTKRLGRKYLPIDDFLNFHKNIGIFIFFLCILHTISHCINLCKLLLSLFEWG
jgi:predicted ferric reductase